MIFKWKPAYSCNIAEIDKQHKNLFEIGSRIYDAAAVNDGYDHYDEIMSIIEELKNYTIKHFAYEEKLMEENNCPILDIQRIEHKFFIKKLQRLETKDTENQQNESLMEMVAFVADWVSSHILKTDMEYKDFLNSKGVF